MTFVEFMEAFARVADKLSPIYFDDVKYFE